jgi:hypothetical protein
MDFPGLSRALSDVCSMDFDISQITDRFTLPVGYADSGYTFVHHPLGVAICSGKVNDVLRGKASSIRLREGSPFDVFDRHCDSVPSCVRETAPYLLRQAFQGNRILFNSAKVRLCSDLLLPALQEGTPALTVQKTDYFSSLCTNEAALRRVYRKEDPNHPMLAEFQLLFPDGDISGNPAVLSTLRQSPCANHVGVSTIGVTEDGNVVWNTQSGRSAQSANRIAPTGSGSADYADLRDGGSLLDFVTRAMERELREECGIAGNIPVRTEIVGFARLLHRGGKPEFFGFSGIGGRMSHTGSSREDGSVTARNIAEEIGALRQNLGGAFSFLMHLNLLFLEEHLQTTRS